MVLLKTPLPRRSPPPNNGCSSITTTRLLPSLTLPLPRRLNSHVGAPKHPHQCTKISACYTSMTRPPSTFHFNSLIKQTSSSTPVMTRTTQLTQIVSPQDPLGLPTQLPLHLSPYNPLRLSNRFSPIQPTKDINPNPN